MPPPTTSHRRQSHFRLHPRGTWELSSQNADSVLATKRSEPEINCLRAVAALIPIIESGLAYFTTLH